MLTVIYYIKHRQISACVRTCVCACVRACVRACVHAAFQCSVCKPSKSLEMAGNLWVGPNFYKMSPASKQKTATFVVFDFTSCWAMLRSFVGLCYVHLLGYVTFICWAMLRSFVNACNFMSYGCK